MKKRLSLVSLVSALCLSGSAFATTAPPTSGTTPPAAPCVEDIDGSGEVDFADMLAVVSNWGATGDAAAHADINNSGAVDFGDLLMIVAKYGQKCG